MERREPDQKFKKHAAKCPSIHRIAIPLAFQKLGRLIEGCANDGLLRLCAIQHGREAKIRDLSLKLHCCQIDFLQKLLLHRISKLLKLRLVREVKQYVG